MNILSLENITHSYTERKLFDNTSFYLHEGEKVGVIGINGTGKSTLLKIMAGLEVPDEGEVIKASNMMIHYLPQNPKFNDGDTVLESVQNMIHHHANENELVKAKSMMTRLGITDFEQKTGELSGGQRKRLALVSVLITPCDILILDEPTNHLDSEMAQWLENQLKAFKGALVMVTHDRYFLDSVTNRIIELDKGKIYSYDEKYSGFLQRKAEREDSVKASERKRQSILRKEIEWMQRGARARSTKQKAHIKRYEDLKNQKGIETEDKIELSSIKSRMGKTTIEMENICKAYGENVLIKDFSYNFLKGDRVGFVGKNGCGKTTLMKIIDGRIKPDSGIVNIGQTIKIGYYTQEIENDKDAGIAYMNPDDKVIDYIKNTAEFVRTQEGLVSASVMLERFLFPSSQQYSKIEKLSGGEKRRLNLLRVLMVAPNVLILDEPTNDLDIETMTILEDYLDSFDGIVITVSHDRYFLDRVVRRIFSFEGNGVIKQYEGGYTDYYNKKQEEVEHTKEQEKPASKGRQEKTVYKSKNKKLKFSYNEQREYDTIEDDIGKLEKKLEKLDIDMNKNATNSVKLKELMDEKEETEALLMEKMDRWEYLEDLAKKIQQQ
ncbi:ABC transporter ATP-binding protein [Eubacterium sp. AF15-50]|uniref:ABC-F family ATP-binding cassette domain-containing protein n=1 Tax=unclassified Eubacterium (in: firmicutes) TaxID=2624479 RepID=UPI000E50E864|nr:MULTISPECIES: ABC-F family ATP-binding cassette domain-containing protein [unclassified Eubacterium (in: firmicutes)]RHR73541.1 ABC transporter ATP-binding protein [Eubacterium sp. AF16-48]RHR81218.1 ABC transporter ATP-binding protein [Eubacterium sp. AF15-50]